MLDLGSFGEVVRGTLGCDFTFLAERKFQGRDATVWGNLASSLYNLLPKVQA